MKNSPISVPLILLSVGCASEGSAPPFSIDTLPTGTVVVSNTTEGLWGDGDAWTLSEEVRIGELDGDGPEVFGRVGDFGIDAEGRFHIFDGQAQELRVFGSNGEFVRVVGRRGEGPGEFSNVSGMKWGPDGNLWLMDPSNSRVTLFDTSGTFVRGHLVDAIHSWPWSGGFDATGRFYSPGLNMSAEVFSQLVLVGYDDSMEPADTIGFPQYPGEQKFFEHRSEGGSMQATVPFAGGINGYLVNQTGNYWFAITDEYRIIQRTLYGDTAKVIWKEFEEVPVSGGEIDSVFETMSWFTNQGGDLDRSKVPGTKPALNSIFVDDVGGVWVSPILPGDREQVLEVFDSRGVYLGDVMRPEGLSDFPRPRVIGDNLYAVLRDDLGVNYVARWRINR